VLGCVLKFMILPAGVIAVWVSRGRSSSTQTLHGPTLLRVSGVCVRVCVFDTQRTLSYILMYVLPCLSS